MSPLLRAGMLHLPQAHKRGVRKTAEFGGVRRDSLYKERIRVFTV